MELTGAQSLSFSLPFPSFPIAVFDRPRRLTYDHIKSREPATMNTLPTFRTELRVIRSARPSAAGPENDRYERVPLGSYFWCYLVLFGAVWCSLVLNLFLQVAEEACINCAENRDSLFEKNQPGLQASR